MFGQGSTLSAAIHAGCACIFTLLAGTACQDKPDEAQPRPNSGFVSLDCFAPLAMTKRKLNLRQIEMHPTFLPLACMSKYFVPCTC
jgi:hypothetical protein